MIAATRHASVDPAQVFGDPRVNGHETLPPAGATGLKRSDGGEAYLNHVGLFLDEEPWSSPKHQPFPSRLRVQMCKSVTLPP